VRTLFFASQHQNHTVSFYIFGPSAWQEEFADDERGN
jgi:hypothetical protein